MPTKADRVVAQLAEQIGRKVAELRRALGMTQEQLAERLEVSVQWLRQIETGKQRPSLVTLAKLGLALDVEVKELFEPPESKEKRGPGRPRQKR